MTELPLEAATKDVIARYKRGNDMLASAAIALGRLKARVDAGEGGEDWGWDKYRCIHLEPHMTRSWINKQLKLAPPNATEAEVAANVETRREKMSLDARERRKRGREDYVVPERPSWALPNQPSWTPPDQQPAPDPAIAKLAEGITTGATDDYDPTPSGWDDEMEKRKNS
jgi:hypothetical protein